MIDERRTVSDGGRPTGARPRTIEVPLAAVVCAAVGGTLASHALEYFRVWGTSHFGEMTSRSVHTYMGPFGVVIVLLAIVGVRTSLQTLRRLKAQLLAVHAGQPDAQVAADDGRPGVTFLWLAATLWLLQLVLYVVQENAEAKSARLPMKGIGVLTGVHAWAPVIHLGVAIVVAAFIWVLRRPVTRAAKALREAIAFLAGRSRTTVKPLPARSVRSWTPAERWGMQRWGRPPPRNVEAR